MGMTVITGRDEKRFKSGLFKLYKSLGHGSDGSSDPDPDRRAAMLLKHAQRIAADTNGEYGATCQHEMDIAKGRRK